MEDIMDEQLCSALHYLAGNGTATFSNGSCRLKQEDDSEVELLDSYSRAVIKVVDTVGPAVVIELVVLREQERVVLKVTPSEAGQ